MSQRVSAITAEESAGSPLRRRSTRIATGTVPPATTPGPAPISQRRSSANLEQSSAPAKITKSKRLSLSQETTEERPETPKRGLRIRAGSKSPTSQVARVDTPAKRGRRGSITKIIEEEKEPEVSTPKLATNKRKSLRGQSSSPVNTPSEPQTTAKPRGRRASLTEKTPALASIDESEQLPTDQSKNPKRAPPTRSTKIDTIDEKENEEIAAAFSAENKTKLTDRDKVKKVIEEEEKVKKNKPNSRTGSPTVVAKEAGLAENVTEKRGRRISDSPVKADTGRKGKREASNSPSLNFKEKSKSPLPTSNRRSSKSPSTEIVAKKSVKCDLMELREKSKSPLRNSARRKSNKSTVEVEDAEKKFVEEDTEKQLKEDEKLDIDSSNNLSEINTVQKIQSNSPPRTSDRRKSQKTETTVKDNMDEKFNEIDNEMKSVVDSDKKSPENTAMKSVQDSETQMQTSNSPLTSSKRRKSGKVTAVSKDTGEIPVKDTTNESTKNTENTERKLRDLTSEMSSDIGAKLDETTETNNKIIAGTPDESNINEVIIASPKRRSLRISKSPSHSTCEIEATKSISPVKGSSSTPQKKSPRFSRSNEETETNTQPTSMKGNDVTTEIDICVKNKSNEEIAEDLLLETDDEIEAKKKLGKSNDDLSEDVLLLSDEDPIEKKQAHSHDSDYLKKRKKCVKDTNNSEEDSKQFKKGGISKEQPSEEKKKLKHDISTSKENNVEKPTFNSKELKTTFEETAAKSEPDSSNNESSPMKKSNFKSPKSPIPSKNRADPLLKNEMEMSLGSDGSFHLNLSIAKTNSQESLTENILEVKEKLNTSNRSDGSDKENHQNSPKKEQHNIISQANVPKKSLEGKNLLNVLSPKKEVVVLAKGQTSTPKISSIKEKNAYDPTVTSSKGSFDGEDSIIGYTINNSDDVFVDKYKNEKTETKFKKVTSKDETEGASKNITESNDVTTIKNLKSVNSKNELNGSNVSSKLNNENSDDNETEEEEMEQLIITDDDHEESINSDRNKSKVSKEFDIKSADYKAVSESEDNVNSTSENRSKSEESQNDDIPNLPISKKSKNQALNNSGLIDSTSNAEENFEKSTDDVNKHAIEETINTDPEEPEIDDQNKADESSERSVDQNEKICTNSGDSSRNISGEQNAESNEGASKNNTSSTGENIKETNSNPPICSRKRKREESEDEDFDEDLVIEDSNEEVQDSDEDQKSEDTTLKTKSKIINDPDDDEASNSKTSNSTSKIKKSKSADNESEEVSEKNLSTLNSKKNIRNKFEETREGEDDKQLIEMSDEFEDNSDNNELESFSKNIRTEKPTRDTKEKPKKKDSEENINQSESEENSETLNKVQNKKEKCKKIHEKEMIDQSDEEDMVTTGDDRLEGNCTGSKKKKIKENKIEHNSSDDEENIQKRNSNKLDQKKESEDNSDDFDEEVGIKKRSENIDNSSKKKSKKRKSSNSEESYIDDLLTSLVDKKMLEYNDSDDESEDAVFYPTHPLIDDVAFEGEEDTPSEGSNDIVEQGESLHSSDSEDENEDDDSYENDSFIVDDESVELLSGHEYDIDMESKPKKKKSRIIECLDSDSDKETNNKNKSKDVKKGKRKSRIIKCSESEDDETTDVRNKSEELDEDNIESEEDAKHKPILEQSDDDDVEGRQSKKKRTSKKGDRLDNVVSSRELLIEKESKNKPKEEAGKEFVDVEDIESVEAKTRHNHEVLEESRGITKKSKKKNKNNITDLGEYVVSSGDEVVGRKLKKKKKAEVIDNYDLEIINDESADATTKSKDKQTKKSELEMNSQTEETPLGLGDNDIDTAVMKEVDEVNASIREKRDFISSIAQNLESSNIETENVDDEVISIEDSEPEEDVVKKKEEKIKIIQDIKLPSPYGKSLLVNSRDNLNSLEDLKEESPVKNCNTPNTSFVDTISSRRKSSRKTSISFQENIKITENTNSFVNEKITKVVDFLCCSIPDNKGNLSLNVSLDYVNSSNEDDPPSEIPITNLKKPKTVQEMQLKTIEIDLDTPNVKKKKTKNLKERTEKKKKRKISTSEKDGESSGFSLLIPKKSNKIKEVWDIEEDICKEHKVSKETNKPKEEFIERKRSKKTRKNVEEDTLIKEDLSQHKRSKKSKIREGDICNFEENGSHNKSKKLKTKIAEDLMNTEERQSKKLKESKVDDIGEYDLEEMLQKSSNLLSKKIKEESVKPKKRTLQDCFSVVEVPKKKSKKNKSSEKENKTEKEKWTFPEFHISTDEPMKKKKSKNKISYLQSSDVFEKPVANTSEEPKIKKKNTSQNKIGYLQSSKVETVSEKPTASMSEVPHVGVPKKKKKKVIKITPSSAASVVMTNWKVEEMKKLEEVKSKLLKNDFRNQTIYDTSRNRRMMTKKIVK